MPIILVIIFFFVAVVFSMLGQGGGALYTPIQVLMGGDFHEAATTSLFLIMVVSASSTLVFRKNKRVDVPLVLVLEAITATGAFAGGLGSVRFSGATLSIGFAAFIVFAALFMILPVKTDKHSSIDKQGPYRWKRVLGDDHYSINLLIALPASFAAGMASGLLGVGGGLVKVPLMVLLLGIPMDIAIGSSALMIGITAATGFAGHAINGHWNWKLSLALAVVVFLGAQIGARFSLKIDKHALKRAFGWFLVCIAAIMVLKAFGVLPGKHAEAQKANTQTAIILTATD
ncbi:hypothetical protein MNBD_PLANCTO03-1454 [hydrothermal vent metagenome]|uniref:Membrane transporter protein n=1 Tax=hydrothermal vent metagenome TaxID=652676 RepID=A0A3B1E0R4_9ZZZZ